MSGNKEADIIILNPESLLPIEKRFFCTSCNNCPVLFKFRGTLIECAQGEAGQVIDYAIKCPNCSTYKDIEYLIEETVKDQILCMRLDTPNAFERE